MGEPCDLCALRPDLPRRLADIAMRALAKQREARFASITSLIEALQPFTKADSTRALLVTARASRAPISRSRRGTLAALIALALCAAAGVFRLGADKTASRGSAPTAAGHGPAPADAQNLAPPSESRETQAPEPVLPLAPAPTFTTREVLLKPIGSIDAGAVLRATPAKPVRGHGAPKAKRSGAPPPPSVPANIGKESPTTIGSKARSGIISLEQL